MSVEQELAKELGFRLLPGCGSQFESAMWRKCVELKTQLATAQQERDEARGARKHTWSWITRHYGKLEDWARKQLPEPYATEFFNCVANGTSHHTKSDYFRQDDAGKQLVYDQMQRAEAAESRLDLMREVLEQLPDAFGDCFYARHDHEYSGLTVKNWLREYAAPLLKKGE